MNTLKREGYKMLHEKLIRDNVPAAVAKNWESIETRIATQAELPTLLRNKLSEEVAEFLKATPDKQVEELADILEVLHALGMLHGVPPGQLEIIRAEKAQAKGQFEKRIVLIS